MNYEDKSNSTGSVSQRKKELWWELLELEKKYGQKIDSPESAAISLAKYRKKKKEHFLCILLDGQHCVIKTIVVSVGIANRTLVHPREVFQPAIKAGAVSIVLGHNHPSGNTEPSSDDETVNQRLIQAGEILGISVLDHVIIAEGGFYSFLEHKKM